MTVQEFPLAWRWTQPTHALLSPEVLTRIRPLSPSQAARARVGAPEGGASAVSCSTSDSHPAEIRSWLLRLQPNVEVPVAVCWSKDLGVETDWGLFVEHWDDFCYPFDEVTIQPVTGGWLLLYHGEEQFEFVGRP